jgi:hypothetical protein
MPPLPLGVAFLLALPAADPAPPLKVQFGINPDGITSAAMKDALARLQEAGTVPGRKGSLTFFRWAAGTPPRLAHLGLWGSKVTNDDVALVAALPDLEFVSLYETSVDDTGIKTVAKLPKLRAVAVTKVVRYEKAGFGPPQWSYPFLPKQDDRPRVTGDGLRALAAVPGIESLDLLDTKLTSADLAALAGWPKLGAVALPNAVDADTVKHLRACKRLSALTLGHREIAAAELEALAAWPGLRKLTIAYATLSDDALTALGKLDSVEELELRGCGLTDDRLKYLRAGAKLSSLALDRNEIAGPGLAHLVPLKLKGLALEFNAVTDGTLSHLTQLATLETLGIGYNLGVTDAGVRSGTLQAMTHLKELRLRGLKQVTDASADALARFGHLAHLNIRETKTSPATVGRLQKAMPDTVVFK